MQIFACAEAIILYIGHNPHANLGVIVPNNYANP